MIKNKSSSAAEFIMSSKISVPLYDVVENVLHFVLFPVVKQFLYNKCVCVCVCACVWLLNKEQD